MRRTLTVELACVCSLALTGCPVDDRSLGHHAGLEFIEVGGDSGAAATDGGTGGAGIGGTGVEPSSGQAGQLAGGTGDQSGSGGAPAGASGAGGAVLGSGGASFGGRAGAGAAQGGAGAFSGACPDLDDDGVPDCTQTQITNAAFATDAAAWTPEPGVTLAWVSADAGGASDSGALGVTDSVQKDQDGSLMTGATQCQAVTGGGVYRFTTEVSVPNDAPNTSAGFQIIVSDGPRCTGTTLDTRTSMLARGSAWQLGDITYRTPTSAQSVNVRLVSVKPFADPPVTVLFDNVLMHPD